MYSVYTRMADAFDWIGLDWIGYTRIIHTINILVIPVNGFIFMNASIKANCHMSEFPQTTSHWNNITDGSVVKPIIIKRNCAASLKETHTKGLTQNVHINESECIVNPHLMTRVNVR